MNDNCGRGAVILPGPVGGNGMYSGPTSSNFLPKNGPFPQHTLVNHFGNLKGDLAWKERNGGAKKRDGRSKVRKGRQLNLKFSSRRERFGRLASSN